jgi:hypothetical protein
MGEPGETRPAAAPDVFDAKPGQRIRVQIINAGADTRSGLRWEATSSPLPTPTGSL